mmetsp:Transcript_3975/g.6970  ORF Transcript_3975/g.6970 Transcript_3975/m.6970 type:complete len:630 (-) Transcript_3975:247-2136(-)|eukprot:CAMPEP_0182450018 /NCGR_PEP_ID=MMETSP1172-20130603/38389_1 /TAXON_ID=708627 /ORGANISM="Timspurckia oligopyrenoides, Strain CCMP3278" /LENGTH=629 /DNA_ID=CAMNT_0024647491 /DNA_START=336 /DNA_END=2225 /DNA_ORIENTATION=-
MINRLGIKLNKDSPSQRRSASEASGAESLESPIGSSTRESPGNGASADSRRVIRMSMPLNNVGRMSGNLRSSRASPSSTRFSGRGRGESLFSPAPKAKQKESVISPARSSRQNRSDEHRKSSRLSVSESKNNDSEEKEKTEVKRKPGILGRSSRRETVSSPGKPSKGFKSPLSRSGAIPPSGPLFGRGSGLLNKSGRGSKPVNRHQNMSRHPNRNSPPIRALSAKRLSSQHSFRSDLNLSIVDLNDLVESGLGDLEDVPEEDPLETSGGIVKKTKPKRLLGRRPMGLKNIGNSSSTTSLDAKVFNDDGTFEQGGFVLSREGILRVPSVLKRISSDRAPLDGIPNVNSDIHIESLDEIKELEQLGVGAGGRVFRAEHSVTGTQLAVKVINVYDERKRAQFIKELETMSALTSRFLVRFHGAFYDGHGTVHIAMEYMDLGALSDVLKRTGPIPEAVVTHIARHCLMGLHFLHKSELLHRDLKTANILLSRKAKLAKLSDFGLARNLETKSRRVFSFVGTMAYMSPERLDGSSYTYASDIWGFGVSIAECLLGRYPWDKANSYFDYVELASSGSESLLPNGLVSSECQNFIRLCTAVDPAQRPRTEVLLNHPWITNSVRDECIFEEWLAKCN